MMATQSNPALHEALSRNLARNLTQVEEAIAAACREAGRSRDEVELVAVSKTHPAAAIEAAIALGLRVFGENRVQEFAAKSVDLGPLRSQLRAHLIGHLQSNKDAIDSVDSLKLAERLDEAAGKLGKRLPILLEIKLSHEPTKAGLDPSAHEFAELLERLPDLAHIDAQGLMTIAPLDVPEDETRACFRSLRQLRDQLMARHTRLNLPVLSMGMSGDFALAIAEGATRIRIGTALFGQRDYSPAP
jgi:pyridoxal phosphate enzyme (YggS family)